jgi:cysteine synthase A
VRLLKAYGAEVDLVSECDPATGEFLQARLNRVQALLSTIRNAFWPRQYANPQNPIAHHTTMHEIAEALDYQVDFLLCSTGTCGTLRGCAEYIRQHRLPTKVIAVDAVGSVIFAAPRAPRLIPGHGASIVPELCQPGMADRCLWIRDVEAIVGCRHLARRESLLAGGSSGAVVAALEKLQAEIPAGANCALILPDRGERYLETIYSDAWVADHFGDIFHLWEKGAEAAHAH